MTKNNYNGDCYYGLVVETYNLFHPQENINDAAFYKKLIHEIDGAVLEIMCGSGRVIIPLLRQNIDIDGLDCSNEMLASCREQVLHEGLNCNLYEQYAQLLLEKAGFCEIRTYGDFQDKDATEENQVVTIRSYKKLNK